MRKYLVPFSEEPKHPHFDHVLELMWPVNCIVGIMNFWANTHLEMEQIEDKLGKTLEHMGTGEIFLNRTPIVHAQRSRINKSDLIKLQRFCMAKDTVNRTKW